MGADNIQSDKMYGFPPLPLEEWETTKETLHLYVQIVGKIKLMLMPRRNHWWNVMLQVNTRGIGTGTIPYKNLNFEIDFDFVDHQLIIKTSEGDEEKLDLKDGLSVATFYTSVIKTLQRFSIKVKILAKPFDLKSKTPFAEDNTHKTYNKEQVNRYWRVLSSINQVMNEFIGRFYGKTSPVLLFWHHFDLTFIRYSGKSLPMKSEASTIEKDSYSHELISFGFWPGDDKVRFPAFFSYTYPNPDGVDLETLQPKEAFWDNSSGTPMAMLKYDNLRLSDDPRKALLDFLESAYKAGAELADWPVEELRVIPLKDL